MPVFQIYFADPIAAEIHEAARELGYITKKGLPDSKEYIKRVVGEDLTKRRKAKHK